MKHICPICRRPTDSEQDAEFPFCSERCRLVDLGNWASEKYVVSEPVFEEDDLEALMSDENTPDEPNSESSQQRRRKYGSDN
jgi:endogenous inhibitor of DNA gyrase (YacG/DUF329 family)